MNVLQKDITTVTKGIIVHGVNCQGRMRSGVAKAIRETWPQVYSDYMKHYLNELDKEALLGQHTITEIVPDHLLVINAFTQYEYGYDGRPYADINAVVNAFRLLNDYCYKYNLIGYAPRIGAGLGGLDWEDIENRVNREYFDSTMFICDYVPEAA